MGRLPVLDQRAVRAAEQSVAARKLALAAQWSALRTRIGDTITGPSALGTFALLGGIIGWRAGSPGTPVEVECKCPEQRGPSMAGGAARALAIATLQAIATVASQEFLRSMTAPPPSDGGDDSRPRTQ